MRRPGAFATAALVGLAVGSGWASGASWSDAVGRSGKRPEASLPRGFVPAVARAEPRPGRYFVVMRQPSVAEKLQSSGGPLSGGGQRRVAREALRSQEPALDEARAMGGRIVFRYADLLNGFSADLTPRGVGALDRRPDVRTVQPVPIIRRPAAAPGATRGAGQSVSFIGAPKAWRRLGARGQGVRVADVDTGIDYTHRNFGGPGKAAAYRRNDPNWIEPGTFPTRKVIAGYDLVGSNYDVLDDDPANDVPRPDPDPLDRDGHGSHTAGSCCGKGVPGRVGKGVAPRAKLYAIKVWDVGSSTADVLVAGFERAMDPNDNGSMKDAADLLTFSGGVDYGTRNSIEAQAAQRVVRLGTVLVAAAGNAGNQPTGGSAYVAGSPANAPGAISVAASISQFKAQTLSVDSPPTSLPDDGLMVHQDWSGALGSDLTDRVFDARAFDPPADPASPSPTDQMLCEPTGDSFDGRIALIFKASADLGDCTADHKVASAEQMGARAVILWNGFGGLPSQLGTDTPPAQVDIPAAMLSTSDSEALAGTVSPDAASASFNTVPTTVTLHAASSAFPQFRDAMTAFTSEGPARLSNDLKPDVSAPGSDILSTAVGTGNKGLRQSGTSMATPHVAGVAALLRQIHPGWSVARIKAAIMDTATRRLSNNDLSAPVPATVMGAGRVRADRATKAESVATPGSLSFGLRHLQGADSVVRRFAVANTDRRGHRYAVSANLRYADYDPDVVRVSLSLDGRSFGSIRRFRLGAHDSRRVWVKLSFHPTRITEAAQEYGWYYFNPGVDGSVRVKQTRHGRDWLRVAWHGEPLAASNDRLSRKSLGLGSGPETMTLRRGGAGVDQADLYQLGATDPVNSTGEEDITAIGARSFTGTDIDDGDAAGAPAGADALAGLGWQQFLSFESSPDEPIEFGVQTAAVHNTTETEEVDVLVDAGADGVFADPDLRADYLVVKLAIPGGVVCVFDLSEPDPFDRCSATYFPDYTGYDGNLFGLVVDAREIGLSNAEPELSYRVIACTGALSGDVPDFVCDAAGRFDPSDGTYAAKLDAADPALRVSPQVCGGFWAGGDCDAGDPIEVDRGSAAPSEDPRILALFPNNPPARWPTVVGTSH
jgi:minor extracellular serine protease Vpr